MKEERNIRKKEHTDKTFSKITVYAVCCSPAPSIGIQYCTKVCKLPVRIKSKIKVLKVDLMLSLQVARYKFRIFPEKYYTVQTYTITPEYLGLSGNLWF